MFRPSDLRPPEWLLIAYFVYVALTASWFFASFSTSWKEWAARGRRGCIHPDTQRSIGGLVRDVAPLAFTLAAYREMNWFTPATRDHHLEHAWIVWDRWLLDQGHLRSAIESAGALLPSYLELCYVLVYGVAPISLALLFLNRRRESISRFWLAYLAGTLGAYALFPYFPSEPPRLAFSGADLPQVATVLRQANLWILGGYANPFQRIPERARFLRILSGMGATGNHTRAAVDRMADGGIRTFGRDRDGLWTVSLRSRCIRRIRGQPGSPPVPVSHLSGTACCIIKSNGSITMTKRLGLPTAVAVLFAAALYTGLSWAQQPGSSASADALPIAPDRGAAGLSRWLRALQTRASILMITAHPDDEDGGMLAYETRGQGARGSLLTLNRGEGGQNEMSMDLL